MYDRLSELYNSVEVCCATVLTRHDNGALVPRPQPDSGAGPCTGIASPLGRSRRCPISRARSLILVFLWKFGLRASHRNNSQYSKSFDLSTEIRSSDWGSSAWR